MSGNEMILTFLNFFILVPFNLNSYFQSITRPAWACFKTAKEIRSVTLTVIKASKLYKFLLSHFSWILAQKTTFRNTNFQSSKR